MKVYDIYPLVIVADRYRGCYSGGEYLYSGLYSCESVRCPECNELHLLDGMKPIVYHGLKERG